MIAILRKFIGAKPFKRQKPGSRPGAQFVAAQYHAECCRAMTGETLMPRVCREEAMATATSQWSATSVVSPVELNLKRTLRRPGALPSGKAGWGQRWRLIDQRDRHPSVRREVGIV